MDEKLSHLEKLELIFSKAIDNGDLQMAYEAAHAINIIEVEKEGA